MTYFHVAYFIDGRDVATLTGETVQSETFQGALKTFMYHFGDQVKEHQIKYIIKL